MTRLALRLRRYRAFENHDTGLIHTRPWNVTVIFSESKLRRGVWGRRFQSEPLIPTHVSTGLAPDATRLPDLEISRFSMFDVNLYVFQCRIRIHRPQARPQARSADYCD